MDKYAVLGNPVEHSKSPVIHTMFASSTKQQMEYGRLLCPLDAFKETVDTFKKNGGKGLNITVPFKEEAYQYATTLTPRAKIAKAVNTLKFNDDGEIIGDNTDGYGFIWDIKRLGWDFNNKKLLLIGAGGALKGILFPILEQEPKEVYLVNRTIQKALDLQKQYPKLIVRSFEELNGDEVVFDYIINCTSLSLTNQLPNLDKKFIHKNVCVYDLMYASEPTIFLSWAKNLGAQDAQDGLGMLVGQAALSFKLWRGVIPEAAEVFIKLRELLHA